MDGDTRGRDWWKKPRAGASSAEEVAVAIAVVVVETVVGAVGPCESLRLAAAAAASAVAGVSAVAADASAVADASAAAAASAVEDHRTSLFPKEVKAAKM